MERFCFTMRIRPGQEAEYERRHDEIWPELVAAIQDAGVRNYTLFRRGSVVTAYAECHPDAATAFGRVGATDVNARWSASFADILEEFTDPDGALLTSEEVWHLD